MIVRACVSLFSLAAHAGGPHGKQRERGDSCRPGLLSSPNEEGGGVEQVVNKEGMHNRESVCVSGTFLNVNKIYT